MIEFTHDEYLFMSYFKTFPKSKLIRTLEHELHMVRREDARKRDLIESILDKLEFMSESDLDALDPVFDDDNYTLEEELLPSWRRAYDD